MARIVLDRSILEMALIGYEAEKTRIAVAIAAIEAKLGQPISGRPKVSAHQNVLKPRAMSAAARKRIAAAQRKRWAAYRKEESSRKPSVISVKPVAKPSLNP